MIRTLVVHMGGIGDFLLACDAIARLGEDGPVELIGQPSRLELAVAGGLATAAHDLHGVDFDSAFSTPSARLARLLHDFDRAVVWMRDEGRLERSLRACGVGDVSIFPGLPPDDWRAHASHYYLSCLGYLPKTPFRLDIVPDGRQSSVVIHPGSGGKRKNWPIEQFRELTERLTVRGQTVAWLMGPAEEDLQAPSGVECIREHSLVSVAARLAGTTLFVGNDSGMTHLAATVGCATVAIFGSTDPVVWAPLGEHVVVLREPETRSGGEEVSWPTVADVLSAVYDHPLFGRH